MNTKQMNKAQARGAHVAQHTPGPWQVAYYGDEERAFIQFGALKIASIIYQDDGNSNTITHTNARLIAAAPELLQACKSLVEIAEGYIADACMKDDGHDGGVVRTVAAARAAIAKAEGKL